MLFGKYRLLVFAAFILVLSGCAQQPYVAPNSGAVAALTIVNRTTMQAFFRTFDDEDCTRGPASGLIGVLQSGFQLYDNKPLKQTSIRADHPFVFSVDAHTYGAVKISCGLTGVFTPEAGASYEMEYIARAARCNVELRKTTTPSGEPRRETVAIRRLAKSCHKFG